MKDKETKLERVFELSDLLYSERKDQITSGLARKVKWNFW